MRNDEGPENRQDGFIEIIAFRARAINFSDGNGRPLYLSNLTVSALSVGHAFSASGSMVEGEIGARARSNFQAANAASVPPSRIRSRMAVSTIAAVEFSLRSTIRLSNVSGPDQSSSIACDANWRRDIG